jgi:hypothetical protein
MPEVIKVVVNRHILIEVTKPFIEALAVRNTCTARFTQAPFARNPGSVTGGLEDLSYRDIFRPESESTTAACFFIRVSTRVT